MRRNLNDCPEKVKADCFKILARPVLEYACSVWDPHHQVDINSIDKVQKRAARFATGNYKMESGNTKMNMKKLKWKPLEERRAQLKLNILFKAKHGLITIPLNIEKKSHIHNTRNNNQTYIIPSSNVDSHKYSFFPNTIRLWNALPDTIKNCNSSESFKNNLNKITLRSSYY